MYLGAAWLLMGFFGRRWPLVGPGAIISSQAIKIEAKAGARLAIFPSARCSRVPCTRVRWPSGAGGGFPQWERGGLLPWERAVAPRGPLTGSPPCRCRVSQLHCLAGIRQH